MLKVTTIIAHKNYLNYLPAAVESALNQTYNNKICIIDDGSDCGIDDIIERIFDETPEFVKSLPGNIGTFVESPRIQLFKMNESFGPSAARNIGIKYNLDTTDAFMILDADDQMFSNKIERFVSVMMENLNSIGVVYADYIIDKGNYKINEYKKPYSKNLLRKECIIHSGSLVNSKVFKKVGFYDETLRVCEDYDLWLRMCEHFISCHIAEPLTLVLDHSGNSTNTVKQEIWQESWLKLKNKYKL
jgi:glycosyltransferase involved in cell wall biosynthesis